MEEIARNHNPVKMPVVERTKMRHERWGVVRNGPEKENKAAND